jgi:uncharacterized membrane protein
MLFRKVFVAVMAMTAAAVSAVSAASAGPAAALADDSRAGRIPLPGAGVSPTAAGDSAPPAAPSVSSPQKVSSGAGAWQFNYNYLGCANSTLQCSKPTTSRYSPESPGWVFVNEGDPLEVRLWSPFVGTLYWLIVEAFLEDSWRVVAFSTRNTWQQKVTFRDATEGYYRFRAWHVRGAGYYVLSWKTPSINAAP